MKFITWKELNWAWEAYTENRLDDRTLIRYELQKIFAAFVASNGVKAPMPSLDELNPLQSETPNAKSRFRQ